MRHIDAKPNFLLLRAYEYWDFPKGIVEPWQSPEDAALEEAFEEAGVRGSLVGNALGDYEYEKWDGVCRVDVFLMRVEEVLASWPEAGIRERVWVGVDEAVELVEIDDVCRLIQQARALMK